MVCDYWGDDDTAHAEMRAQCVSQPIRLQRGLLEHFEREYGGLGGEGPAGRPAKRDRKER